EIVLVKLPDDSKDESAEGNLATDTKPAANAKGEPATHAAESAERESLQESLKVQTQESPLITMIRSIL
ncbi:MAG: hypothetical protein J6Y13_07520, partial [Treponema sp.]|nr:hypothetical protein [Treponema sp.]